jgi:metallo-beta-lactamase class B
VMDRDFEHLKSGGKTDPVYGKAPPFYFPEVTAERMLKDGATIALGDIKMIARLGAGHSQGATTWITTVKDGKRSYRVVFPCCTGVNPSFGPIQGHRLVVNPSYPGIADDYRRSFKMLAALKPDIWLAAHTEAFDFEGKRGRAAKEGVRAWIDPDGYRKWLMKEKETFDALVTKEKEK